MKSAAIATLVLLLGVSAGPARAEALVTPQEAALPPAASPKSAATATRALTRPPQAVLVLPGAGKDSRSPVHFSVRFSAHGGTTIDAAATKVFYVKTPLVDLTPRLGKFITPSGIEMPVADVPAGEHTFVIELVDSSRHTGSSVVTFKVEP